MPDIIDLLDVATQSPQARFLPLAIPSGESVNAWWDHVNIVLHQATESDLMIVALYARAAMDTYQGLIDHMHLSWWAGIGEDDTQMRCENSMRLNGEIYHPEITGDEELIDRLAQVDDLKALNALQQAAENALGDLQSRPEYIDRSTELFGNKITSVEDADQIIGKIDPAIRSFYEQALLKLQTPQLSSGKGMGRI